MTIKSVDKEASKEAKVEEIKEENLLKKIFNLKLYLFLSIVISAVITTFVIYNKKTLVIEQSAAVGTASFSIMFNIVILAILFGTGIGQELLSRFKRRLLFRTGRFVNTLFISKNGPIKEHFVSVDKETGSFRILDKPYTRNPSLLHHYKNIPTYIHREGNPDPVNIFEEKLAGDISNSEIDHVMLSKNAFDFKLWLQKNGVLVLIVLGVLILVGVASTYFGWSAYQMLRDGTFQSAKVILSNSTAIIPTVL